MARTKQAARQLVYGNKKDQIVLEETIPEPKGSKKKISKDQSSIQKSTLTVAQLRSKAKNLGIDLKGVTKKADIISAIDSYGKSKEDKIESQGKKSKAVTKKDSKKSKTTKANGKFLTNIEKANDLRQEIIGSFWEEYTKYLDESFPDGVPSIQILNYLSGIPIKHNKKTLKIKEVVLDSKVRDAMMALMQAHDS